MFRRGVGFDAAKERSPRISGRSHVVAGVLNEREERAGGHARGGVARKRGARVVARASTRWIDRIDRYRLQGLGQDSPTTAVIRRRRLEAKIEHLFETFWVARRCHVVRDRSRTYDSDARAWFQRFDFLHQVFSKLASALRVGCFRFFCSSRESTRRHLE